MTSRVVRMTLHTAPPVFSWCDPCMKSTAYTVRLYRFVGDEVMLSGEIHGCTECGRKP